jgi:hypothetical protein
MSRSFAFIGLSPCRRWFAVLVLALSVTSFAQEPSSLPRLVKFTGTLPESGHVTTAVFALYSQSTGGAALWQESQSVTPDSAGRYTVLLGSRSGNGVPVPGSTAAMSMAESNRLNAKMPPSLARRMRMIKMMQDMREAKSRIAAPTK